MCDVSGTWTVRTDDSGMNATIRNLKWPGFEFQTEAHNPTQYAGAYYGTGERNLDVLFML